MRKYEKFFQSTVVRCFQIFTKKDQRKLVLVVIIQVFLGMLDLLGVALIGIIGALAVSGIQSSQPGNRVGSVLNSLNLQDFTFQQQTAILAVFATAVLIGKTLFSIFITRRVLYFIAKRSAVTSGILVRKLLQQNNLVISNRTIQDTIYSLTSGVTSMNLGVVGTLVYMIADVSLLMVMGIGLIAVDPLIALSTVLLFSCVGYVLYRFMHVKALHLGKENAKISIGSNEMINEVLTAYREATVRNRRSYYAHEIGKGRLQLSNISAEQSIMPTISKYVVEITLVLGAVSISATQFAFQDSKHAVATLAVFLAAGTRIAPAVLRIQQGAITIKTSVGAAKPTLDLIDSLQEEDIESPITKYQSEHLGFNPNISINDVSFNYPNNAEHALNNISLQIPAHSSCALVGPSGAGKTTLVDLILGMFKPTFGHIYVSNLEPIESITKFPGAIGYVPQDVTIFQGSIRQNIALGYPIQDATDERIEFSLEIAQLSEFVNQLPNGIDTEVGPRGSKLSGGQRQRLGIARAMFTKPKLLILDESTSALDAQTELAVSEAISAIPYEITTIIIAHRLSTVRKADQVVYLEAGDMVAKGTFEEVRAKVRNFDDQAKLMGL